MIMDRKKVSYTYDLIPWTFGEIGLVRHAGTGRSPICRILLPKAGISMTGKIRGDFPGAALRAGKRDEICLQIRDFLSGKAVDFTLEDLDFGIVKGFARRVLQQGGKIPRGLVTTYGGLAASLGVPGGARAVGNALAGNPFSLVIPCHRVIRSDGSLGGFGGGLTMKRALLEMEGVRFDSRGRVLSEHIL
jgi:methylated-DNA-[protein]-cysteine S-methyltransferase